MLWINCEFVHNKRFLYRHQTLSLLAIIINGFITRFCVHKTISGYYMDSNEAILFHCTDITYACMRMFTRKQQIMIFNGLSPNKWHVNCQFFESFIFRQECFCLFVMQIVKQPISFCCLKKYLLLMLNGQLFRCLLLL